jgi:predicted DNA-binding transcriptional regulator AlpA
MPEKNGIIRNGTSPPLPPPAPKRPPGCTCPDDSGLTAIGLCLRCHAQPGEESTLLGSGLTRSSPTTAEETELVRHVKIVELEKRLGRARRTIREWYARGDFPKPHYCGPHRCWYLVEIQAWEAKRPGAKAPAGSRPA